MQKWNRLAFTHVETLLKAVSHMRWLCIITSENILICNHMVKVTCLDNVPWSILYRYIDIGEVSMTFSLRILHTEFSWKNALDALECSLFFWDWLVWEMFQANVGKAATTVCYLYVMCWYKVSNTFGNYYLLKLKYGVSGHCCERTFSKHHCGSQLKYHTLDKGWHIVTNSIYHKQGVK